MPRWATTSAPDLGKAGPHVSSPGSCKRLFGVSAHSSVPAQVTLTHRCADPGDKGADDILLPGPCSYTEQGWVLDSSGHVGLHPCLRVQ